MIKRREFMMGLGGAVARPFVVRAQQRAMPLIGYLSAAKASAAEKTTAAFRQGLGELGYVEGRNVEILYRWAENRSDQLPSMAGDLVNRGVDVIFACSGPVPALAAKAATTTIPVVFQHGSDGQSRCLR